MVDRRNINNTSQESIGREIRHESARLHVTGRAIYTDDIPEPRDLLHVAIGSSKVAHGRIESINLDEVTATSGVMGVMTHKDIRGHNNFGAVVDDDPLLSSDLVEYVGQPIFAVAATSHRIALAAAAKANIKYGELVAILDTDSAIRAESFVVPTETMRRGDVNAAIAVAAHRSTNQLTLGGQDQFYLEGHIAMAIPQDDGGLIVYSSTQHPDEVQHQVAHATGRSAKDVIVICRRMGGGFGGKETQPALFACIAISVCS